MQRGRHGRNDIRLRNSLTAPDWQRQILIRARTQLLRHEFVSWYCRHRRKHFGITDAAPTQLLFNHSRALLRFFRRVHPPAASTSAFDKPRSHAHRFVANRRNANLVKNLQSRLARIERRYVWSAVQIAERVVARIVGTGFESKGTAMRDPPGERGTQPGAQIFADVKVGDTRPTAQPLEDSAHRKINAQPTHVERNRSRSLKNIENYVGADPVSPFNNGARVNDAGTPEKNLRNGHEECRFVDGGKKLIQINANVTRSRHNFHTCAKPALLVVEVLNRRKLQLDHHHLVAWPAKVKARRNHRLGERHILVQRNLAGARSN